MPKKPMPKKESKIEEAQRLLQEEHQKNVEAFQKEYNALEEKYGLTLNIQNIVKIVPKQ